MNKHNIIKERDGFKIGEKVHHKNEKDKLRNYGDCIIKEFDDRFLEDVLIFVYTDEESGYEAYVNIKELSHGWKERY